MAQGPRYVRCKHIHYKLGDLLFLRIPTFCNHTESPTENNIKWSYGYHGRAGVAHTNMVPTIKKTIDVRMRHLQVKWTYMLTSHYSRSNIQRSVISRFSVALPQSDAKSTL